MKLVRISVFNLILFLTVCVLPVWAASSNNSYDERFNLKDKKAITNFLKNNDVLAGAVKWSSAIGGSKQKKPWALLLKSNKGIFNCYLTFSQSDIEALTCDRYDY